MNKPVDSGEEKFPKRSTLSLVVWANTWEKGVFLQVIPHLSLIKHSVISSDEEEWLAEGKPVELLFGADDLYIHYIDKSIGTPFFRTEKCTSKSVATTMGT